MPGSRCVAEDFNRTDFSVVHSDDRVRDVEIRVVVTDDDDSLALSLEFGKYFVVEDSSEHGVLIGCPLIEDVDWAIF
jgi:hypothetical protein